VFTIWTIDEDEAVELLRSLVAIDSVNPSLVPGAAGEREAAEYVLGYLRGLGLPARLDEVAPGRPNAVAVLPAGPAPDEPGAGAAPPAPGGQGRDEDSVFAARHGLIINGHLDTASTEGMTHDPHEPRVHKGKVYGRGAFDMKGGVVMGLLALAVVARSVHDLHRSVLFTAVVDEEYASIGTQDVVKRYAADGAVVLEPTGLTIHLAHKGFAWVAVETLGRAAHGSLYREGVDAITKMGQLLVAVERMGRGFLEDEPHPLLGHRSIHASLIEGGRELSTYPDRCLAQFERRTLPGEDPEVGAAELERLCAEIAGRDPQFRASITPGLARPPYEVDRDEGVVRALASSYWAVMRRQPEYRGSTGWLDSALLGAAGIPTVIFGPAGDGAHSAEEYVTLKSVIDGAKVLAEMIMQFCG